MPQDSNHMFNRKKIQSVLKTTTIEDLTEGEIEAGEINEIIKNWQTLIKRGVLDKKNEVSLQDSFLNDFFIKILQYKNVASNPDEWNFEREQSTNSDATRSDGALGFFYENQKNEIHVAIELKSAKAHLDQKQIRKGTNYTPIEQAFMYASKFGKCCKWVVVSNYKEIRFYHSSSMNEYEVFFVENLTDEQELKKFIFLLFRTRLIKKGGESRIDNFFLENEAEQDKISKVFYDQYKMVRYHLFEHLRKKNPSIDELILIEKTQKTLDRFIFICFCEDTGLLPDNIFRKVIEAVRSNSLFVKISAWDQIRALFRSIDKGDPPHNINRYNGGLFAKDELLDKKLYLDDEVIHELAEITNYDFESDLNVNILGHIFEQSISDIEELKDWISGEGSDKKKGKRKKEGIYYTPEFITHYIVENAVGGWLQDRRDELGFGGLPELTEKDYLSIKQLKKGGIRFNKNIKAHLEFWEGYKKVLSNIKVLDPACGSGAFLNQAFDYLFKEGQDVNRQIADLQKGQMDIFGLDRQILQNNLFGVDLNPESVEITKLGLWLKTANKQSELTALDKNILCGNSLIEDPSVAGDKAFKWNNEFPEIIKNGGFDVVIGNPPYIPAENISEEHKKYLEKNYDSAFGRLNIFPIFFEKALLLLKKNGYTGYITPYTILKNQYYIEARRIILNNTFIKVLVDFKNYKVFEDAVVDSIILVLIKEKQENNKIKIISNIKNFQKNIFDISHIDQSSIKLNEDLSINFSAHLEFNEKIYNDSIKLKDIVDFDQGIITGNNKKFLTDSPGLKTKKVLMGKDFNRYSINYHNIYIIYDINELHRPRTKKIFETKEKILLRQTGSYPICTLDTNQFYTLDTVHNGLIINSKFNSKYLLSLLNSKLFKFLYEEQINETGKVFAQVKIIYINPLPVKDTDNQQPFIEKADSMLDLNKNLNLITKKFIHFIESSCGPKTISNKLKLFYTLESNGFVNELKKQKVSLSKKDEYELMEIFEDEKEKCLDLKNEIDQTDSEIDQMVYKLYDLTPDEIEIIEKST